jgi:hypothetical protein
MTTSKPPSKPIIDNSEASSSLAPHPILSIGSESERGVAENEAITAPDRIHTFRDAVVESVALHKMLNIQLAEFFDRLESLNLDNLVQHAVLAPENFSKLLSLLRDLQTLELPLKNVQEQLQAEQDKHLGRNVQLSVGKLRQSMQRLRQLFDKTVADIRALEARLPTGPDDRAGEYPEHPPLIHKNIREICQLQNSDVPQVLETMKQVVSEHIRTAKGVLTELVKEAGTKVEAVNMMVKESGLDMLYGRKGYELFLDIEKESFAGTLEATRASIQTLLIILKTPTRSANLLLEKAGREKLAELEVLLHQELIEADRKAGEAGGSEVDQLKKLLEQIRFAREQLRNAQGTGASLTGTGISLRLPKPPTASAHSAEGNDDSNQ